MSYYANEQELFTQAQNLAGLTLETIANKHQVKVPTTLQHDKGWIGQLIEKELGATAGSEPIPDFPLLGVELKTLPVDQTGKAKESTFICSISLLDIQQDTWHTSLAYQKLKRILWIPIEATPTIAIASRRIGTPLLWSPNPEEEAILKQDWEELTNKLVLGQIDEINARQGKYLQIRPKAANARALCRGIGEYGQTILTLPRGFYLRTSFTNQLLKKYFVS